MRRSIRVKVAFAPTRLSTEHLQSVYDELVPSVRRLVESAEDDVSRECFAEAEQAPRAKRARGGRY